MNLKLLDFCNLTTFSSFSSEVVQMLIQSRYGMALLTAAVHWFGSLLLTLAGIKTVHMLWMR
jgi:CrcB protein